MDEKIISEILKIINKGNAAEIQMNLAGEIVVLEVIRHKKLKVNIVACRMGGK